MSEQTKYTLKVFKQGEHGIEYGPEFTTYLAATDFVIEHDLLGKFAAIELYCDGELVEDL